MYIITCTKQLNIAKKKAAKEREKNTLINRLGVALMIVRLYSTFVSTTVCNLRNDYKNNNNNILFGLACRARSPQWPRSAGDQSVSDLAEVCHT